MTSTKPVPTLVTLLTVGALSLAAARAESLLLDFGQTTVAAPYLTLSPGHAEGPVLNTETSWNKIISSAFLDSLVYGDGSAASGVALSLGQEASVGNNIISFSTAIANTALAGTGGGIAGRQSLLSPGSIYGDDTSSTAVGRDGFFGGGSAAAGAAVGLRLDGLAAGDYFVYVMARNVNSNAELLPMNVYTATALAIGTFDFSGETPHGQSNVGYLSAGYAGQYNNFVEGENFVRVSVSLAEGESLFLAVDSPNTGTAAETRGFVNSVAVAPVPEPSMLTFLLAGGLGLFLVRRWRQAA